MRSWKKKKRTNKIAKQLFRDNKNMKKYSTLILLMLSFEAAGQVIPEDVITSWGYEKNPRDPYMRVFCAGTISPLSSEYQSIRLTREQNDTAEPRFRFTLGKEIYQSKHEAQTVVSEISEPLRRTSKHSKLCDIRKAFNVGSIVYFVHTDVGGFRAEIDKVIGKVYGYLQEQ